EAARVASDGSGQGDRVSTERLVGATHRERAGGRIDRAASASGKTEQGGNDVASIDPVCVRPSVQVSTIGGESALSVANQAPLALIVALAGGASIPSSSVRTIPASGVRQSLRTSMAPPSTESMRLEFGVACDKRISTGGIRYRLCASISTL